MKIFPKHICSLFFLICLIVSQGKANTKRALLIGIGQYEDQTKWSDLGSRNDVEWLSTTLETQGFLPQNISTLTDAAATREGILVAIKTHLIQKVQPNDIVVFHFSGHGQQVADDNGDEADGYDEALVPYDSPKHYEAGKNEGEQLLRDEELGHLLNEIRRKIGTGGHLLVLIDACHSGTGTRFSQRARGTAIKMASPEYETAQLNKTKDEALLPEVRTTSNQLAPMVAFFSAAPKEQSFEVRQNGKQFGLLSYSFCKTIANLNQTILYTDLLNQIQAEAIKNGLQQRPQAEGNLDLPLFNHSSVPLEKTIKVIKQIDRQTLQIDAGLLQNISKASTLTFYAAADLEFLHPIAQGTITRAGLVESTVRLTTPLTNNESTLGLKAILTEQHYKHLSLDIQLNIQSENLKQKLLTHLSKNKTLKINPEQPEVTLVEENQALKIVKFNGTILSESPIQQLDFEEVEGQLIRLAQVNFLRALELHDKNYQIQLELINVETGEPCTTFKVGSTLQLRLKNTGLKKAFYQIVDIMPNDEFGVAIPLEEESIYHHFLESGASKDILPTFTVNPPLGTELFKVIAAPKAFSLREILINKGQQKASHNALGVLMQAGVNGNLRSGSGVKARNISVQSVVCQVVKNDKK